jgi:hypothetical protein
MLWSRSRGAEIKLHPGAGAELEEIWEKKSWLLKKFLINFL